MIKNLELSPIHKILVANRGEIALRIRRAARLLHIPVVAVCSGLELDSSWNRQFEESCSLGMGNISQTYLNISLIISLAKQSGADAIHPGYGFLSENPMFALACEENHIKFIGPSSNTLKLMGDKLSAHTWVAELGIPVTDKIIDSPHEIRKNGHKFDYPVLVKAAAGGGGKGMRIARSHHELTDILEVTANEAYHFFADNRVFVEKFIRTPRHIEVQILGDSHGQIVHLFERECSIQRRHQKIIEEAPATCLSDELRGRIIDAALTIARSVRYVNAGTIEFLLDESGDFYFLEMNPRIQVEHGITEMVTGIDLVKEQIMIAEGRPLSFSQPDISCQGNAIEARIYAEDPENDLMPSPGRIHFFGMPSLEGIRVESAVSSGSHIPAEFDPLVAKVIAYGKTRKEAIRSLENALNNIILTGVRHNIPLIRSILQNEDYLRNAISTTYLQDRSDLFLADMRNRRENESIPELLMAGTLISLTARNRQRQDSVWQCFGYWRMVPRLKFQYLGNPYGVYYQATGNGSMYIWHNRKRYNLSAIRLDDNMVSFECSGSSLFYYYVPENNGIISLTKGDLTYEVIRSDRLKSFDYDDIEEDESVIQGMVRSPLPGKVSKVYVTIREKVNRGDNLLTIESMKLENSILAPLSGIVEQIRVTEGEQVRQHDPLIIINPEPVIT